MNKIKPIKCPLCIAESNHFQDNYYECNVCSGVFLDADFHLDSDAEKKRYLTHHNDVTDKGYQAFVNPIVTTILTNFETHHIGLDFGAGTGPVAAYLLKQKNYNVQLYDPFFYPDEKVLKQTYDYIICCEVMEHFYNPNKEFTLLNKMLNKGGMLICYTDIFSNDIDFSKWYYRNDPTHVFFYRKKTLEFIQNKFSFSAVQISNRLIVLKK